MKAKLLLTILCYFLTWSVNAQVYSEMTSEKVFFYNMAINNFKPTDVLSGRDYIDIYGCAFDNYNYKNSTKDEFEKNSYREKIKAKILDRINKVNFNDKFSSMGNLTLGEYSFSGHFFPITSMDSYVDLNAYCNGSGQVRVYLNGITDQVINKNDFSWALKMSEEEANAFIKSRKNNQGEINRKVYCRIDYSVMNIKQSTNYNIYEHWFKSFFYSIDVYEDSYLTKKLGSIPLINNNATPNDYMKSNMSKPQVETKKDNTLNDCIPSKFLSGNKITTKINIGDKYAGGIVFYIDKTGQHGFVSAETDQQTKVKWGCPETEIGTSRKLGCGEQNTKMIVKSCPDNNIAAKICDDLILNGYDDWFLPSIEELNLMKKEPVLNLISWLEYISSSENGKFRVWGRGDINYDKRYDYTVRAIRAF